MKKKKIEKEKKHDRMERAGIQSSIEKNGERTGWLGFPEKFHARTRKINRNVPVRDPRSADAGMRILDMVGVRFHGFESRKIHAWSWYTAHAPSTIASCSSRSRAWNLFSPLLLSLSNVETRGSCEIIVDPGGDCALARNDTRGCLVFSKNFLRNFNPKVVECFTVNFLFE